MFAYLHTLEIQCGHTHTYSDFQVYKIDVDKSARKKCKEPEN